MHTLDARDLPLHGVKVLSLEQFGAGPFGTLFLSSLGANVIKVEQPGSGDISRQVGPHRLHPNERDDSSLYYQSLNFGKQSITLDVKHPQGREVLRDLMRHVDALTSNLRGDVVEKLGLTYEQIKEINPALVCCHLTAYGRDNERVAWPGYDYAMQAEAGYCTLTGEPGSLPTRFGLSVIDWMSGVAAALGTVSGVLRARTTGLGGDVDVNLFDIALFNLSYVGVWQMNTGHQQEKILRGGHPSQVPSQMCKTADGWVYIMCGKDKFWRKLCRVIDREAWMDDPRFRTTSDRVHNRELLSGLLDDALSSKTTAEWLTVMAGVIPVGPVLDVEQALRNPYLDASGRLLEVPFGDSTIKALRNPVRWNHQSPTPAAAPRLGQNTHEILSSLGYDSRRIEALQSCGAI